MHTNVQNQYKNTDIKIKRNPPVLYIWLEK